MKSEDSYVKINSEWAQRVKEKRQEQYRKVMRGLTNIAIPEQWQRKLAARVCRELWNIRWQPLREVN